jgi:hypothetical protein
VFVLAAWSFPRAAVAEKILTTIDDWQIFTDGRTAGYASWVYGQGFPRPTYGTLPDGTHPPLHNIQGGGFRTVTEQGLDPTTGMPNAGTINMTRVRSGFISNVLGFGVRAPITPYTTVTAYIQLWAFVESEGRQKNRPNYVDARQGYTKVEGLWGSFLAGRTRALFSRGATDIDVLYAHRWGVGYPGSIDSNGPTLGQIGFGVLGSGFASGLIYGTPVLGGLQLNIGLFDPIQLQGNGGWNRTKYGRPEAELTFERKFGATGKIVLFANGAYQRVYKEGYCPTTNPDPTMPALPCQATAAGFGYGGRFEYGPLHVGAAAHYGNGLGLNYALEVSDAAQDPQGNMRKFDGYYVQSQVVLRKFELTAGWGIARVFLTNYDSTTTITDPTDPTRQLSPFSVIKYQMGENAGIVYNVTPNFHLDLDFFRAEAAWYLGERQVVYVANGGMVFNW